MSVQMLSLRHPNQALPTSNHGTVTCTVTGDLFRSREVKLNRWRRDGVKGGRERGSRREMEETVRLGGGHLV